MDIHEKTEIPKYSYLYQFYIFLKIINNSDGNFSEIFSYRVTFTSYYFEVRSNIYIMSTFLLIHGVQSAFFFKQNLVIF